MFSRLGVNSQGELQLFRSERSERWWEGRQRSRQAGKLWKSKPGKEGGREGGSGDVLLKGEESTCQEEGVAGEA